MTPPASHRRPEAAAASEEQRSRRLVVLLLIALSLAAFSFVTLGASAQRGPLAVFEGESGERTPIEFEEKEEYTEPDWTVYEVPEPEPQGETSGVAAKVGVGALVVALLVFAVLLFLRLRKLSRPPREEAAVAADEELSEVQARAALDDARERLVRGADAQDAVIAAWRALEEAIARAGVRRDRTQTTLEFVVAVLGSLALDRAALDRLAHLYRRALFDDAPLEERDREDAHRQLDHLVAQLKEAAR